MKTIDCDIAVIGGGASGLTAARRAKELGDVSVLILEKRHVVGGNAGYSGAPIPTRAGNGFWKSKGHEDKDIPPDDPRISDDPVLRSHGNFRAAMEWTHWRADARIVRALANKYEEADQWFAGLKSRVPEGAPRPEQLLIPNLKRECLEMGIDIICNAPAKKILKDENGVVNGVLADTEEGELRVNAKSVIVATGGYFGDTELMQMYFPYYDEHVYEDLHPEGLLMTGDGIKMASEAGAASDGTVCLEWIMNRIPFYEKGRGNMALQTLSNNDMNPEVLWVNQKGERFADESKINASNSIYRQPRKASYIVFDEALKNYYLYEKTVNHPLAQKPLNAEQLEEGIREMIELGIACKADTLEEAAAWLGTVPGTLKNTLETYNKSCDEGFDSMFCKASEYMIALRKPPYYFLKSGLAMLLSHGPLKVNTEYALLDKNDDPISGLFASGVDTGGVESDTYVSSVMSHSIKWAVTSGMIAGESAFKYARSR